MCPDANGWNEWSRHVLAELERLDDDIKELKGKINDVRETIIELKIRVALIGGLSGLIVSAIITLAVRLLSK